MMTKGVKVMVFTDWLVHWIFMSDGIASSGYTASLRLELKQLRPRCYTSLRKLSLWSTNLRLCSEDYLILIRISLLGGQNDQKWMCKGEGGW